MGPAGIPGRDGRDRNTKPILVIRFPESASPQHMSEARNELKDSKIADDYHIITTKRHTPDDKEIRFEVLNCPDIDPGSWNDLVNIVLDDIDPDRVIRRESEVLIKSFEDNLD